MSDDRLLIQRPDTNVSDLVVAAVQEAIADGSLTPGQRLTERELIERTGVSRPSIREALSQLRKMGLVEERTRGGLQVAVLDRATIDHIYDVRAAIEPMVAELFTTRATDEEVTELLDAYGLHETPKLHLSPVEDLMFLGARNPLFREIMDPYHARIRSIQRLSLARPGRYEAAMAEYGKILDAIQRRKPREAANAVRRHIAEARRSALAALISESDPGAIDASRQRG